MTKIQRNQPTKLNLTYIFFVIRAWGSMYTINRSVCLFLPRLHVLSCFALLVHLQGENYSNDQRLQCAHQTLHSVTTLLAYIYHYSRKISCKISLMKCKSMPFLVYKHILLHSKTFTPKITKKSFYYYTGFNHLFLSMTTARPNVQKRLGRCPQYHLVSGLVIYAV